MRKIELHWGRVLPAEGVLAGLASLSVAWPLTTLLDGSSWWQPAAVVIAVVAITGMLTRLLGFLSGWVCLTQLFASMATVTWLYLGDSLAYGLPTASTLPLAGDLLQDAGEVLRTFAAPAPVSAGVAFLVVLILGLTCVAVDTIGVTAESPAAAGIPLAATFMVSVSNNGDALRPWFFVATGGLWLLLIIQQHRHILGSWPSRGAGADHDQAKSRAAARSGVLSARVLVGAVLVCSVVLATLLPHLPPTFLSDGLATNPDANNVSGGTGGLSFIETMDPAQDLRNQSQAPVLAYTTDAQVAAPLRVTSTSNFSDGVWQPPDDSVVPQIRLDEIGGGPTDGTGDVAQVEVLSNNLNAPHLAISTPLDELGPEVDPLYNPAGATVVVDRPAPQYSYSYIQVPRATELAAGVGESAGTPPNGSDDLLFVPAESRAAVVAATSEAIGSETSALTQATLIQNYLRGPEFTYSLDLLPTQPGVPSDPVSQFLANRQGYCVQFATAMVMMARSQGIPARMAVGFLPGERTPTGERFVLAADAHTWPELYLDGLGWTSFEPTPGTRSGAAPSYAQEEAPSATPSASADPTTEQPSTTEATPTADPANPETDEPRSALSQTLLRALWVVLGLLVILALLLIIPILSRRRMAKMRQDLAQDPAGMESAWKLLALRLEDLGLPRSPQRSPRAMRDHYLALPSWPTDASDSLERLTSQLEAERYAPNGSDAQASQAAIATIDDIVAKVAEVSDSSTRLRARWIPSSGLPGLFKRF